MRFTIDTQNGPRALFSVDERKDGGLIVTARGGELVREHGREAVQIGPRPKGGRGATGIANRRISIHPSPISPSSNLIHFRQRTDDGQEVEAHHLTAAIKRHNRFAIVQAHQFGELTQRQNLATSERTEVSLGEYDDGAFAIMTMLLASSRERVFEVEADDFSYVRQEFERFALTLLWSFAYIPAGGNHCDWIPWTDRIDTAPTPQEAELRRIRMRGVDEVAAVAFFKMIRDAFREEIFAVIRNGPPPGLPSGAEQLSRLGYYKRGKDDAEFVAELRRRVETRVEPGG